MKTTIARRTGGLIDMEDEKLPSWVHEPKTEDERIMQRAFEFGVLVGKFREMHEQNLALLKQIEKSIEELR
jgi:hypothetical protein